LYPASYYRLQEAADLKLQIEQEEAARQAFYANFDSRQLIGASRGWGVGGDLDTGGSADSMKEDAKSRADEALGQDNPDSDIDPTDEQADLRNLLDSAARRNIV